MRNPISGTCGKGTPDEDEKLLPVPLLGPTMHDPRAGRWFIHTMNAKNVRIAAFIQLTD